MTDKQQDRTPYAEAIAVSFSVGGITSVIVLTVISVLRTVEAGEAIVVVSSVGMVTFLGMLFLTLPAIWYAEGGASHP